MCIVVDILDDEYKVLSDTGQDGQKAKGIRERHMIHLLSRRRNRMLQMSAKTF